MSFSAEVKEELCALGLGSDATLKAQAYGMLLFGRAFSADRICLYTENEKVAHLYAQAIDRLIGIQVPVERSSDKKEGSRFFVVSVPEERQREPGKLLTERTICTLRLTGRTTVACSAR